MTAPAHTHAALEPTPDPIVVMVAAGDGHERERLCAAVSAMRDVSVVEVESARQALQSIQSLYERPRGCPDILLLSDDLADAEEAGRELCDLCPGVHVLRVSGSDRSGLEQLGRLVEELRITFA